jgi:hypothetical protein
MAMWIIIKYDKKNFYNLQKDLIDKIGEKPIIFSPKIKLQYIKRNKVLNKVKFILNDYLFCYHKKFEDSNFLQILKYVKGLKDLIPNFKETQNEITNFIQRCKKNEDKSGFLTSNFFNFLSEYQNKKYKFQSGPFTSLIFKIIETQKDKLFISIGNYKTTVKNNKFLFETV